MIAAARTAGARTLRDIAVHLNAPNVPTTRGGAWGPSMVKGVLYRLAKTQDERPACLVHRTSILVQNT
jgi:hypothetical protein